MDNEPLAFRSLIPEISEVDMQRNSTFFPKRNHIGGINNMYCVLGITKSDVLCYRKGIGGAILHCVVLYSLFDSCVKVRLCWIHGIKKTMG